MKEFFRSGRVAMAALLAAGTLLAMPCAQADRKEASATTVSRLQTALGHTLNARSGQLVAQLSFIGKDKKCVLRSVNKINGSPEASVTSGQLTIESPLLANGKETFDYYIVREGEQIIPLCPQADIILPLSIIANGLNRGFELYEIFGDKVKVELMNRTAYGRSIYATTDAGPLVDFVAAMANYFNRPELQAALTEKNKQKLPKLVYTFRIDNENECLTNANVDATRLAQALMKLVPPQDNGSEQEKFLRQLIDEGNVNFHLTFSRPDEPIEMTLPEDVRKLSSMPLPVPATAK